MKKWHANSVAPSQITRLDVRRRGYVAPIRALRHVKRNAIGDARNKQSNVGDSNQNQRSEKRTAGRFGARLHVRVMEGVASAIDVLRVIGVELDAYARVKRH